MKKVRNDDEDSEQLLIKKKVFLVRHAESVMNKKARALKKGLRSLNLLKLAYGLSLLGERSLTDSDLTQIGRQEAVHVKEKLLRDNFFEENAVEAILCSPLTRALSTCTELITAISDDNDITKRDIIVIRQLLEQTPLEFIKSPLTTSKYVGRIRDFEYQLSQRPEKVIFVVGHSIFFKKMLGMQRKFNNLDVYEYDFQYDGVYGAQWLNGKKRYVAREADEHITQELAPMVGER